MAPTFIVGRSASPSRKANDVGHFYHFLEAAARYSKVTEMCPFMIFISVKNFNGRIHDMTRDACQAIL